MTHNTEGFWIMICHHSKCRVSSTGLHSINITYCTFLRTNSASKIPKMINCQRNVSSMPFSNWFSIIKRFCKSKHFSILFNTICYFEQDVRPYRRPCFTPIWSCLVSCVQSKLYVFRIRSWNFTNYLSSSW